MKTATAIYQGRHIESRQGEDGKYRAYIKEPGCTEFKLVEDIKASPYARKVVSWTVKKLQEESIKATQNVVKSL